MKILLGVSGSIATTVVPKLVKELESNGFYVTWLFTKSASRMMAQSAQLDEDYNEFRHYKDTGKVLHIEFRKQHDLFLIAPLSANTLAKISNGLCDNVLTNVARCWDYKKPMILAPAMNTMMWDNLITRKQVKTMRNMGARFVEPCFKTLACGDTGVGALAPIKSIVEEVKNVLSVRCYEGYRRTH